MKAYRIHAVGIVQGVGFRPPELAHLRCFVSQLKDRPRYEL